MRKFARRQAGETIGTTDSEGRTRLSEAEAARFGAILDEIERLGRLTTVSGSSLTVDDDETGRRIASTAVGSDPGFAALLSGTTSPYSFTEQDAVAGGTWTTTTGGRTGTTNAYELNGLGGLGGKVAWIWPDPLGSYRFKWWRGVTPPPHTSICFKVRGCGSAVLPGATVTIKDSLNVTMATLTTDSTGTACWGLTKFDTFSWTVAYSPNFVSQTGSFTSATASPIAVNLVPNTASNYYCFIGSPGGLCDVVAVLCPATLTLTSTTFGTCTLTRHTSSATSVDKYTGSQTFTTTAGSNPFCTLQAGVDVPITYQLGSPATGLLGDAPGCHVLTRSIGACCKATIAFGSTTHVLHLSDLGQIQTESVLGGALQPAISLSGNITYPTDMVPFGFHPNGNCSGAETSVDTGISDSVTIS